MRASTFAEEATYYRALLLLGLCSPEEAHAWAEAALDADPTPPEALINAVLAPRELTALRSALASSALDPEPEAVVRRLLGKAASDVRTGQRSVDDTMHVLAQMRRMVAVPPAVARMIDDLAGDHMLALAGVRSDLAYERARIAEWLAGYSN